MKTQIYYQNDRFTVRLSDRAPIFEICFDKETHAVVITRRLTVQEAAKKCDALAKTFQENPASFRHF